MTTQAPEAPVLTPAERYRWPATVVTEDWLRETTDRYRRGFRYWIVDQIENRAIESTRPIMITGKQQITGILATHLEQAQVTATTTVSGKLHNIKQNYIGRQMRGPLKVEHKEISQDRAEEARLEARDLVCEAMLETLERQGAMQGSWKEKVAASAAFPGKPVGFAHLKEGRNHEAIPTCDLWDPLTVYHTLTDAEPYVVIHEYTTSYRDAQAWLALQYDDMPDGKLTYAMPQVEAQKIKDNQNVLCTDCWVKERNPDPKADAEFLIWRGILIDNQSAGIHLTGWDINPIKLKPLNATVQTYSTGTGTIVSDTTGVGLTTSNGTGEINGATFEAILEHCQPFWASLKQPVRAFKMAMNVIVKGLLNSADPAILIGSDNANVDIPDAQLLNGGKTLVPAGVTVTTIDRGVRDTRVAMEALVSSYTETCAEVYPPELLGHGETNLAGYAQDQKVSHAAIVLNPVSAVCEGFVLMVLLQWLHDLQRHPELKIRARGRWYSAKDLPDDLDDLSVDWPADLGNKMGQYAAYQQSIAGGISVARSMKNELNINDPQAEMEAAEMEAVRHNPLADAHRVKQYYLQLWLEALDAVKRAQSPIRKQDLQSEADEWRAAYRVADAQFRAMAPAPPPGEGTPAAPPGIGPQFGGSNTPNNPDQTAQANGTVSSALGGQGAVGVTGQGGGQAPPGVKVINGKVRVTSQGGVR